AEYQAGQRAVIPFRKLAEAECLAQIVDTQHTIQQQRAVIALHDFRIIRLVGEARQVPRNRLQNVSLSHDALEGAVLIYDDGHVDGPTPEQIKRLQYRNRLRNDERLSYHASQIERLPGQAEVEEVLFPDNADDLIDRSTTDKEPGEIASEHAVDNL